MASNDHLVPKVIVDLVENKNKPWKSENQRQMEYARLEATRDYINRALDSAVGPEYRESPSRADDSIKIAGTYYEKTDKAV